MHEESPLIEAAHVKLSGISEFAYDLPAKGGERLYFVRAVRDGFAHNEYKTQPDRIDVKMKILALAELPDDVLEQIVKLAGLSKEAADPFRSGKASNEEPGLFGGPAAIDDEPAGPAYDGGPSFSAGE